MGTNLVYVQNSSFSLETTLSFNATDNRNPDSVVECPLMYHLGGVDDLEIIGFWRFSQQR